MPIGGELVLEIAKVVSAFIGPLIGFGGGVILYSRKMRDDRLQSLRDKRLAVYDDYVRAINEAYARTADASLKESSWEVCKAVAPVHSRLSVIAPARVVEASSRHMDRLMDIDGTAFEIPHPQLSGTMDLLANAEMARQIRNVRQELFVEFRRDIFPHPEDFPASMFVDNSPESSLINRYSEELKAAATQLQEKYK